MPRKTIIAALAAIIAMGGSYGGYTVFKDAKKYGADFESRPHLVERVIDGDTIVLADDVRVRLLGINAPERGECYYAESKALLKELVEGEEVYIEKDFVGKDRYGRLLRYIIVKSLDPEQDDVLINNELVRQGAAFAYSQRFHKKYRDFIASSQTKAKSADRGLWGECDYKVKTANKLREQASKPTDPSCTIKGNISEKGYGKIYFVEGCPNYNKVKIDTRKGEAFFCTEARAQKAGFTKSESCNNNLH